MNPILLDLPEQLETERLLLRAALPGDGKMVNDAIHESAPDLQKWMHWARHLPEPEETEVHVRENRAHFLRRDRFAFYIFEKTSGNFVGLCSLVRFDWIVRRCEIGYWIRSSASGRGYMTEAVNAAVEFSDKRLDINRIEIRCDTKNVSSRKVAERCGFHLEAVFRNNFVDPEGRICDDCIYAKVRLDDGRLGY